ncbi:MAG: response regulator [Chloroflexi bacterium]|nr:response regulator [Chloroflexota bacterium]
MSQTPLILIVDDDAHARQTMEMLLLRQGYNLHFAADGPAVHPGRFSDSAGQQRGYGTGSGCRGRRFHS